MKRLIIAFGLLFASTALIAGDTNQIEFEPVPEPPVLPDPLETGENILAILKEIITKQYNKEPCGTVIIDNLIEECNIITKLCELYNTL